MTRLNRSPEPIRTHEGAKAQRITPYAQLRRSVLACMLWEDEFYEDGESIAERIAVTIPLVNPADVSQLARDARSRFNLRHVPLLLARELARHEKSRPLVGTLLRDIIQRPDELTEFLAIYWKSGRCPLASQVKKGLAEAFRKFSEYQLAKYDRGDVIKLRDALFLCHAKPKNAAQEALWKRLVNGDMATPDTWEVELSAGKDKKETWIRLLTEKKLGGLALLRNLRNMNEVGVPESIVKTAIAEMRTDRILPFRFIAAAKYAPQWEPTIEAAMLRSLADRPKLPGKTALVIDGSGSMFGTHISKKSEIDRFEAACALAILAREMCEDTVVVVFSNNAYLVPSRRGFALRDAIRASAEQRGTYTQDGILCAARAGYDRVIIFTDEQSHQSIHNPLLRTKGYVVNVASNQNGIGYGSWVHIDGFSETILDYIQESEF